MKYLFWGILLFFGAATSALAQKNKVKLCLHDNPALSPANQLTYYWWDPYHIHIDDKILDPDGVKKDHYLKTKPPYNYCFMLKAGPQNFKVVSIFNDSIQFNLNLQKDTTLFFQDYVKDFYKIVPDSLKLLENLKFGDNLTIHISKNYSDQFDGLRLDLLVTNDGEVKVIAVNRNLINTNKDLINYIVFNEAFNEKHHKLVCIRDGPMYKYKAHLHDDFKFGSKYIWELCKMIENDGQSVANNRFIGLFN
jgi:hypothetical protein